jgi:hypothetical protein
MVLITDQAGMSDGWPVADLLPDTTLIPHINTSILPQLNGREHGFGLRGNRRSGCIVCIFGMAKPIRNLCSNLHQPMVFFVFFKSQ